MALVNSDLFLVQDAVSKTNYKVKYQDLADEITDGVDAPVDSVNGKIGTVVLNAGDVGAATTAQGALADSALQPGEAATPAQGTKADSAVQPGDNVSALNNDAGYITAADVPDEGLWKEDGDAVTPKATGADLEIEGSITAAGALEAASIDGGIYS